MICDAYACKKFVLHAQFQTDRILEKKVVSTVVQSRVLVTLENGVSLEFRVESDTKLVMEESSSDLLDLKKFSFTLTRMPKEGDRLRGPSESRTKHKAAPEMMGEWTFQAPVVSVTPI